MINLLWPKCNNIKSKEYKIHQKKPDEPFCCQKCLESLPFNVLNSTEFKTFIKFDVVETQNQSHIKLSPSPTQQIIIDKLNNIISQQNSTALNEDEDDDEDPQSSDQPPDNESDKPISCSYYSCDDFVKAKFESAKNFPILHLNIHSIQPL